MKQKVRYMGGRINGRYFRTILYSDGSAFGVVEKKRMRRNNLEGVKGCVIIT